MCGPCFKALGPLQDMPVDLTMASVALPECDYCGCILMVDDLKLAHSVLQVDGGPRTYRQHVKAVRVAFESLEALMPNLQRLSVGRGEDGLVMVECHDHVGEFVLNG